MIISSDTLIEQVYQNGNISVRSYNCCKAYGISTVKDLSEYLDKFGTFYSMRNCGKKSEQELHDLVEISNNSNASKVRQGVDMLLNAFESLGDTSKALIERAYLALLSNVTGRAKGLIRDSFPSFTSIFPYWYFSARDFLNWCPGDNMKNTAQSLYLFKNQVVELFERYRFLSDDEAERISIENKYPFLTPEELSFCVTFHKNNGYLPLFNIILKWFERNEERAIHVKYLYHIKYNEEVQYDFLATELNRTYERVRQLLVKPLPNIIDKEDLSSHDVFKQDIISDLELYSSELEQKENVKIGDNGIGYILNSFWGTSVYKLNEEKKLAVSASLDVRWQLMSIYEKIRTAQDKGTYGQKQIHISILNEEIDSYTYTSNNQLRSILKESLSYLFDIQIDELGFFNIPTERINIRDEIISIFREKYSSLSIAEIYLALISRYPKLENKVSEKGIYPYIRGNERIVALGKTGKYSLKEWGSEPISIRDAIQGLLIDAGVPLPIESIEDHVRLFYPSTNRRSIATSMQLDPNRFIPFKDGLWGLSGIEYDECFIPSERVKAQTNDERLESLEIFIMNNKRMPLASGDEKERRLYRWVYNITSGSRSCSMKDKQRLEEIKSHAIERGYPTCSAEYKFLNESIEFYTFVKENRFFPNSKTENKYYAWYRRYLSIYETLPDQRCKYFRSLLAKLQSLGLRI